MGRIAVVASEARDEGRMPDLGGAVTWLNSAPLNSNALRGRVVLVNFWTYSCINSVRELPYMKAWAAEYKGAGLVVIGVHALEFGFERDPADVKAAVSDLNITYSVPIDSIHSISNNFRNEYWTADCFIDGKRRIRYHHVDEVLRENGATGLDESIVHSTAEGPKAPPSNDVQSPETYVGDARAENFASPERTARDSRKTYSAPVKPALNHWGPGGSGNIRAELATLESASGKIVFRFRSRDLHMVLGPSKNGMPVRFNVRVNGAAPGDNHGSDTAADGTGEVRQSRMYQLVRKKRLIKDVTFEMEFLDPGIEAFSFAFG